jgi:hypothetical protein
MALRTRRIAFEDIQALEALHNLYYPDLDMPDYLGIVGSFLIEDEHEEIVMAGCVELIGEAKLTTNLDMNRIKIGKALVIAQGACISICRTYGITELLAMVKSNPDYVKHLIRHGFYDREQQVLSMRM